MKKLHLGLSLLLIFATYLQSFSQASNLSASKNYQFTNGNWFDGKKFKKRDFYSTAVYFPTKNQRKLMKRLI